MTGPPSRDCFSRSAAVAISLPWHNPSNTPVERGRSVLRRVWSLRGRALCRRSDGFCRCERKRSNLEAPARCCQRCHGTEIASAAPRLRNDNPPVIARPLRRPWRSRHHGTIRCSQREHTPYRAAIPLLMPLPDRQQITFLCLSPQETKERKSPKRTTPRSLTAAGRRSPSLRGTCASCTSRGHPAKRGADPRGKWLWLLSPKGKQPVGRGRNPAE